VVWRVTPEVAPEVTPEVSDPVGDPVTPQVTGQATGQVTGQVRRLLAVMVAEHSRSELQALLGLKHRDSFIASYLQPALAAGRVEMTIPEKPRSGLQKYRLSQAGKAFIDKQNAGKNSAQPLSQ
jgi:ATP-dependent DNA helicase RecG